MHKKLFYITIFILTLSIFSAIFPYPILSNYTNITDANVEQINNYLETEISNISSQNTRLLDLSFNEIDCLLPIGSNFEIIDLQTGQTMSAKRIGGKNHFDIEFLDTLIFESSWDRIPVLVKFNEYCYFPASLISFAHGYSSSQQFGHYCLHFKNSKLDSTEKIDPAHQDAVDKAYEQGGNFIKDL